MSNAAISRVEPARRKSVGERSVSHRTVPMDTFKWIVSGLLGTLLVSVGWFLSDIRADLRDVRKDVTAIRVEAAATNTRLESLVEDRRRMSR
ncbi:hypothetical protein SAMN02990966_05931 [Rhodospirillales bacterium URHD0017]|nr:hypothetical protein SAMN02990966_05931 [Rhodospirillales bacterium URHD0017]